MTKYNFLARLIKGKIMISARMTQACMGRVSLPAQVAYKYGVVLEMAVMTLSLKIIKEGWGLCASDNKSRFHPMIYVGTVTISRKKNIQGLIELDISRS
jgi:hypothetical protein